MDNLEIMCELSDFYLKFIKENQQIIPNKPILTLSQDAAKKLKKWLNQQ